MSMQEENVLSRFWAKVRKTDNCWEWTASKDRDGYGIFCISSTAKPSTVKSHRFSALLAGIDIDQKVVRHKCHNPACVNPDHLLSGTQADNVNDMMVANRQNLGHGGRRTAVITPYGEFNTVTDAAKALNLNISTVIRRLNRKCTGWHRK
jgi:hypothetical protein